MAQCERNRSLWAVRALAGNGGAKTAPEATRPRVAMVGRAEGEKGWNARRRRLVVVCFHKKDDPINPPILHSPLDSYAHTDLAI